MQSDAGMDSMWEDMQEIDAVNFVPDTLSGDDGLFFNAVDLVHC